MEALLCCSLAWLAPTTPLPPTRHATPITMQLDDPPPPPTFNDPPTPPPRRSGNGLRENIKELEATAANLIGVTPPWITTAFGCNLFVLLDFAAKQLTILTLPSPELDAIAARTLAVILFAAIQQIAFIPLREWLTLGPNKPRDPNPVFQNGPYAGVTFAFIFAVPLGTIAQLCGIPWLPEPKPFPAADGALLNLLVAPLSEEIFFRSWLLTAFEAAGGSQAAALIASTALFGLYHVPFGQVLAEGGSAKLLVYEALGAYLSFLYQRSGGSLPLAFVCHATCNLIVLGLAEAQVGSMLPF